MTIIILLNISLKLRSNKNYSNYLSISLLTIGYFGWAFVRFSGTSYKRIHRLCFSRSTFVVQDLVRYLYPRHLLYLHSQANIDRCASKCNNAICTLDGEYYDEFSERKRLTEVVVLTADGLATATSTAGTNYLFWDQTK